MKPGPMRAAVMFVVGCVATAGFGQAMPGPQFNPAAARIAGLFGKTASFTATGQISSREGATETINDLVYAMRDGKVRIEMDFTKSRTLRNGKPVKKRDDDDMEGMASMGLSKLVTLVLPDKPATYLVYPSLKSYCDAPTGAVADEKSKTEWKELGKDTVDGHPCIKYLVTTTNADGTTEQHTAWKASDLKDFILQIVSVSNGQTTTIKYTNVQFEKPAAALFELPPDFKKYGSMQELIMGAMQRMMGEMH